MESDSDYSHSQVPAGATYTGWHIALIIVGGTIAIPGFLMAAAIGGALGLRDAAVAFAGGCVVLGILAALTSRCGQKSGLSAYVLNEFAFGRIGGRLANLAIACSLIGWFGVTSAMLGRTGASLMLELFGLDWPMQVMLITGSVLILGVTLSGFKGIDRLALALVPAMLLFLLFTAWLSYDSAVVWQAPPAPGPLDLTTAISAVIGSYIAGVAIQPDYSRFARSRRAAWWAAFLALGVSFPLVLFLTAIPAVAAGERDLLRVMLGLGVGVPAFLLLILAAWSSNVLSLYSGSLSLATIFRQVGLRTIILVFGLLGTILGLLRVDQYLVEYLVLLGISIPPIAGIYAVETLVFRTRFDAEALQGQPPFVYGAMIAWAAGIMLGYLAQEGVVTLTGVAALDSALLAASLFLALRWAAGHVARRRGV